MHEFFWRQICVRRGFAYKQLFEKIVKCQWEMLDRLRLTENFVGFKKYVSVKVRN